MNQASECPRLGARGMKMAGSGLGRKIRWVYLVGQPQPFVCHDQGLGSFRARLGGALVLCLSHYSSLFWGRGFPSIAIG